MTKKKDMKKKSTKNKKEAMDAELKIYSDCNKSAGFMFVEQDGYKAVFHEKEHRDMVSYLLADLEGAKDMIRILKKAIDGMWRDR